MFAEIYYRIVAQPSPEESLGRLLVVVFGFGMAAGLLMNLLFAVWISIRFSRLERCWMDREKPRR